MDILMMSYEFPPIGGGGSRVVYGLSTELVRQGHSVDLLTMHYRGLSRYEEVNGVRVRRVPCFRKQGALCTTPEMVSYDVSALLAMGRPDPRRYTLNHTHFIFPNGLVSMLARRRWGIPYVITAHGSDVPGYNPNRFKLQHRLLAPLWRRIVRDAEQIICPSDSIRSLILSHAPRARTTVVPNGFDPQRLKAGRPRRKRVLAVTRLFKRKGVQHLIEAARGLDPDWEIHVVGDGPYRARLVALALELGVRVRFHGWLDNDSEKLRDLYETSGIFVLPSEAENFPVVLLEAMAAGLAVVTTRGTGCAEVVGETGLLVDPRSPEQIRSTLDRLVASPELRATLGQAGRRRLEDNFSWSAVTRSHVELYERHARS